MLGAKMLTARHGRPIVSDPLNSAVEATPGIEPGYAVLQTAP
jgi:hypothetical protein